jgi:hypothetical protein
MLTPSQLAAVQSDLAKAFTTTATIKRSTIGSDELGDDATDPSPATIGTVKGWLSSSPNAEPTIDGGIVTANTYRFDCPVGTDIQPRDTLVIGSNSYVVTDTTADETIPLALAVSLRLRE